MPDSVDRLLLLPRYSAFVGTTAMYTAPVDVRRFSGGNVTLSMGTGLGSTPAIVEVALEESADLENWREINTFSPSASGETVQEVALMLEWLRLRITVSGSDPGVTCWMAGEFVFRKS